MLRLPLIVGALAVLALSPPDAGAQQRDKGKSKVKLCPNGSTPLGDRCVEAGLPASRQIGGSSFSTGGSPFPGGSRGYLGEGEAAPRFQK